MGFSSEDLTNKHGDINRTYSLDLLWCNFTVLLWKMAMFHKSYTITSGPFSTAVLDCQRAVEPVGGLKT